MANGQSPNGQPERDPLASFVAACGLGIAVELMTHFVNEFIGLLPEPFSHFLWFPNDLGWSLRYDADVLKVCGLYIFTIGISLAIIWFCAGWAHGLHNSNLQRAALLTAILVTAIVIRLHENRNKQQSEPKQLHGKSSGLQIGHERKTARMSYGHTFQ